MKNMNIIKKHIRLFNNIYILANSICLFSIYDNLMIDSYIKKSIIFMKIVCIWNNCKLKKKKTRTKMEYIKNVIVIG
ncbi:hypothetical protein PFAG_01394 [Plasmodium falciparum Santa Lucia]|uniref:Uncharacterized protein n=1 Tax=Plasmodium falciparum Santa Lucia TaxID=478859 RepID=W7FM18_PLAFA|nr:hypothetical protein PFAG_01394 [Plasmodium falciparum Santa Lucia]